MIQLTQPEKMWILLCKGHTLDKCTFINRWIDDVKPVFLEIYGWNPDEDNNYYDYLKCLFEKLLDIHFKIKDDQSGTNHQIKQIMYSSFSKGWSSQYELPIERAIAALRSAIHDIRVLNEEGEPLFSLEL